MNLAPFTIKKKEPRVVEDKAILILKFREISELIWLYQQALSQRIVIFTPHCAQNVCSLLPANPDVAFASMSRSCRTWRSLQRSATHCWRSLALWCADGFVVAAGVASTALTARIELNVLDSSQPNSRAKSLSLRPVANKSIICWRNWTGYDEMRWGMLNA